MNDDATSNDQWQPAIAVTPDGADVGVFWYDRRLDPANSLIDRYGAIGTVSGSTVAFGANFRISDTSFPAVYGQDPVVNPSYMGDYDQAAADNNFFYTTWGDNRDTGQGPNVRLAKIPIVADTTDPTVTLTAPNGGETLSAGGTYTVTWNASDNIGVASVDLAYSIDGGVTFMTIASGLANTGSYRWSVPNTPAASVLLQVAAHDAAGNSAQDVSDNPFAIVDTTAPSVTVNVPNGGEVWIVGASQAITWSATDNVGVNSVDLLYSTTGAAGTYIAIATGIVNTGSYVRRFPTRPARIRSSKCGLTTRRATPAATSQTPPLPLRNRT